MPGSRLEIFEQSGHFPHQDEPARFARTLTDFIHTTQAATLNRETLRALLTNRDARPETEAEDG
jgi:hypothetical protein